jgi:hypothetical protein
MESRMPRDTAGKRSVGLVILCGDADRSRVGQLGMLTVAALMIVAGAWPANADMCCYSKCGSVAAPSAVLVTCARGQEKCPRGEGPCFVWAEKTKSVDCRLQSTCQVRQYEREEADTLVERLANDVDVIVVRSVVFDLQGGRRVTFGK